MALLKKMSMSIASTDEGDKRVGVTSDPTLRSVGGTPDRKKSNTPNPRPSVSGSLVGLLASKRMAKRLSIRASLKREGTHGSSSQLLNTAFQPDKEPTYRMEPVVKFSSKAVEDIIKETIDGRLQKAKYNGKIIPNLGKIMSDDIKEKVKKLNYDRYKIICVLMIGENKEQGLVACSRCQWDAVTDTYASYAFQSPHLFCTCTVYGIYRE